MGIKHIWHRVLYCFLAFPLLLNIAGNGTEYFSFHPGLYPEQLLQEPPLGVYGFPPEINPLTGLAVDDPTLLLRRPVMVKISNYPPSVRPQAGLSQADLVFEYYIGEEANRFLATYYGKDVPQAGSLRSGRLVDGPLVSMYGGILVYGSADPRVDKVIEDRLGGRAISHLEAGCPVICGDDTHVSPWVYVNTGEISRYVNRNGINNQNPDLTGMIFASPVTTPNEHNLALKIGIEYGKTDRGEWHFNPDTGDYLRWIEKNLNHTQMVPLTDRLNNHQITAANVILLFASYTEFNPTLHDIQITKVQGQRAIFFRDGMVEEGTWRAISIDRPIQFFNHYGLPMPLKPGNSWIILVGTSSNIAHPTSGVWELQFRQP